MPIATTVEQGRKYAERLIRDTCAEYFGDRKPGETESDLLAFVLHDLTEPRLKADCAASHSSSCSIVIRGESVTLRGDAARAFADALWGFVSERADKIDEASLVAFRDEDWGV